MASRGTTYGVKLLEAPELRRSATLEHRLHDVKGQVAQFVQVWCVSAALVGCGGCREPAWPGDMILRH